MRKFNVAVNGVSYEVEVEEVKGESAAVSATVAVEAAPAAVKEVKKVEKVEKPAAKPVSLGGTKWCSPLPGTILNLKVPDGSTVKKGDQVITLEAMKMENDLGAPADGVIKFMVSKGSTVATNEVLAVIS